MSQAHDVTALVCRLRVKQLALQTIKPAEAGGVAKGKGSTRKG